MNKTEKIRQKILIADDSRSNRSVLAAMLGEEFDILEASDGSQAVALLHIHRMEIALVLLDMVMPHMDGFQVLTVMNRCHWIDDVPVIIISDNITAADIEKAYELGAADYISCPFDPLIVHRRVANTIMLYVKQKRLAGLVADQIYEKEKRSELMIDILSHIVEFRNGESGRHVLHIHRITELLLKCLLKKSVQYPLSAKDISVISMASSLHDIGKIAIPEEILNKPGRLTAEEFECMKTHSLEGATMLKKIDGCEDEPLVKVAYEICRWHHERYDGRGYPDGLSGEEIPISAQIVSLADVYDALTSERVYKEAYSHEKAMEMIMAGECGTFNPLLLDCLNEISEQIRSEVQCPVLCAGKIQEMQKAASELMLHEELSAAEQTLRLLEHERTKYQFFASMSKEIQFEYTAEPPMVTISDWGAARLGLPEVILDPLNNEGLMAVLGQENLKGLCSALKKTTPEQPVVQYDCIICVNEERRWNRIMCRAMWSAGEPLRYMGAIGKVLDVHEEHTRIENLERMASHDALTGLLNHASAKKKIRERLEEKPDGKFALAMIDLDYFKMANDTYGHMFGDRVLQYMADKLKRSIRSGDIAARVGGDEFLIFLEYRTGLEGLIQRIFRTLLGEYEGFPISISMGVARTTPEIREYEQLFHCADQALYAVKRKKRGEFRFYDESMKYMLSVISPIEDNGEEKKTGEA